MCFNLTLVGRVSNKSTAQNVFGNVLTASERNMEAQASRPDRVATTAMDAGELPAPVRWIWVEC